MPDGTAPRGGVAAGHVYQRTGVANAWNTGHTKSQYYHSHDESNATEFVPVGPDPSWTAAHTRDELSTTRPQGVTL